MFACTGSGTLGLANCFIIVQLIIDVSSSQCMYNANILKMCETSMWSPQKFNNFAIFKGNELLKFYFFQVFRRKWQKSLRDYFLLHTVVKRTIELYN